MCRESDKDCNCYYDSNHPDSMRQRRQFIKSFVICGVGFSVIHPVFAVSFRQKKKTSKGHDEIRVSPKERCPVCGMFVSPYPKWLTRIQFRDGSHHSFDGMKCLFRFYFSPATFGSDKLRSDIDRILVRDYYTLKFIDHDKAVYVVGSNVYGPMGHELIPFTEEKTARTFMKDHFGKRLFRFDEVTAELLDLLDKSKRQVNLKGIP